MSDFFTQYWLHISILIALILLAIEVIPPAIKSEERTMSKILQEDYDTVHANIKLAMEGAKKQSDKKYGDQE